MAITMNIGKFTIDLMQKTKQKNIHLSETEKMKQIINKSNLNISDKITLVHFVCVENHPELLKFILNMYDLTNSYDYFICIALNNRSIIDVLLYYGADLNSALNYAQNNHNFNCKIPVLQKLMKQIDMENDNFVSQFLA